jgi:hypothetical protein
VSLPNVSGDYTKPPDDQKKHFPETLMHRLYFNIGQDFVQEKIVKLGKSLAGNK